MRGRRDHGELLDVTYLDELEVAIGAARRAGEAIRALYEAASAQIYTKGDGSPVTDADLTGDRIIREALVVALPTDALLTEEGTDDPARLTAERVWIVDPIDGTQQFVDRTGQFDVLIALAVEGRPVAGVMLQPTTGIYLAAALGSGAWIGCGEERVPFRLAPTGERPPRLITSVWLGWPASLPHLERVAERLGAPAVEVLPHRYGLSGGRMFLDPDLPLVTSHPRIAEITEVRQCDAVLGLPTRPDGTMAWEWDFAALDIVIHEAGGIVTDCLGRPHRYNKPYPKNVGGLVAARDPALHRRIVDALAPELDQLVLDQVAVEP